MTMELVFIPSPGIGHLRSTVELAKQLVNGDERLSITVIIIPRSSGGDASDFAQISSFFTPSQDRLRHETISVADNPTGERLPTQVYIANQKPQVRDAVAKLLDPTGVNSPSPPRLAGFVIDMFCISMMDVADEFGVPTYMVYTSNAAFLGFSLHLQKMYDEKKLDTSELSESVNELEIPCLTRPYPVECLPYIFVSKEWLPLFLAQARNFRKMKGILVNTFAELEPYAMKFFSGGDNTLPTVYPVGPVLNLKTNGPVSTDDKQTEILRWLDEQPRESVVFLCFGSMGGFREDQAKEIAIALERSGHRFLWSLRRALPKGTMGHPGDFTNLEEILPEGFLDRTAKIGKIIGWAPQSAILANPAVRGFVTHCGWNSTLESILFGVPIATWPLYAEQQVNAFEMVEELGLSVEIRNSFRADFMATESELVTAEEIERGIRCLMELDREVKDRVKEMSEKSHVALMEGGSSHASILNFIQDVTKNLLNVPES